MKRSHHTLLARVCAFLLRRGGGGGGGGVVNYNLIIAY